MGNFRGSSGGRGGAFLTAGVITVFLGGLQIDALADSAAAARRAIQAAYDRMDAAAGRKDLRGATAFYAPDFAEVEPRGAEDRAQEVETARSFFASAQSIHAVSTVQSVAVQGELATVVVKRRQSSVSAEVNAGTGGRDRWVLDTLAQDTWTQGRAGWRWTASRRMSARETQNGQPFRPHHRR